MSKLKLLFIMMLSFSFINLFGQLKSSVKHPSWSYSETIYEVNVRQFSKEGTFKAVSKEIPRLKEMGVGIVWLMPVHPIGIRNRKGSLGSYYSVRDYLAVDSSYGTLNDFRDLVNTVHKNGMHIIIDWVANHSAWDNKLMIDHPDYYTRDSLGNVVPPVADWSDCADLNYNNPGLRKYMIDALKFWVKNYDIDGFRCDVADMVPTDFWNDARKELDKIKPVFMLAEAETPALQVKAFDMVYSWNMMHLYNDMAKSKKNVPDLKKNYAEEQKRFPADGFHMRMTTNHDENSWNGTEFERLGDAAPTFAVLTTVFPGMPLVYNGQEAGLNKRLKFFEKDPIEWKDSKFKDLYTKALNLKRTNKALLSGSKGGKLNYLKTNNDNSVLAFTRSNGKDKIAAIFNFSPKEVKVKISGKELSGKYKSLFSGEETELRTSEETILAPWEYRVYVK